MKYLIAISLVVLTGCTTRRSDELYVVKDTKPTKKECTKKCNDLYDQDLDSIGALNGTCLCKRRE